MLPPPLLREDEPSPLELFDGLEEDELPLELLLLGEEVELFDGLEEDELPFELLLLGEEVELLPLEELLLREGELAEPPSVVLLREGVAVFSELLDGLEGIAVGVLEPLDGLLGVVFGSLDGRVGVVISLFPRTGAVVLEPVRPDSVLPSVAVLAERTG